ncbi:recombinase family protein [Brevibacillus choshinensis]|uniref:recombinase family protein n=1 Tax=Brevibacillus choshinensis TaxID=54911 RepID=UPI002E1FF25D|nr:recombinase family protein [Brevibacillus choshinensis]
MNREYAYIRVSDKDQNEDRQIVVMESLNIKREFMFIDKSSGKNFDRPEYQLLRRVLREGDTLVIKSLDRFGRNKQEILREWEWLTHNKIDIVVVDMPILDTRKYKELGAVGQLITDLVLQILSWLAEEERTNIKQRQAEGISVAKSKGKHLGRPKKDFNSLSKEQRAMLVELYPKWKNDEITAVSLMSKVLLKKNTFYKVIQEYESTLK